MQTTLKLTELSSGLSGAATELLCVDPDLIDKIWPHVKHFVKRAIERSMSDYTLDYVYRKLLLGESLLWIEAEGKDILAAATTEICGVLDTNKRVCVITTMGGKTSDMFLHHLSKIEQYAREEKCELVRLYGRPGWARVLSDHGYKEPWVALEKSLGSK
jgi:hypothetical protein